MAKRETEGQLVIPYPEFGRDLSDELSATKGFIEELQERRFVAVQGIPPEQVDEMVRAYADFMQLQSPPPDYLVERYTDQDWDEIDITPETDTVKYWHTYRSRVNRPGKPGGQTNRSLENDVLMAAGVLSHDNKREATDRKEFFHYTPDMLTELQAIHEANGWGDLPPELQRFLELAQPIHERGTEIRADCFYAMEDHVAFKGITKSLISDPDWRNNSPLRILAYHTDSTTQSLGQLHRDKGTATLALDESHDGLRVSTGVDAEYDELSGGYVLRNKTEASSDENMVLVERLRGQAAFFTADGMRRETGIDHPAVEPTYHDIIKVGDKEYIPGRVGRYAVILFMNPPSGTFSSKASNHGAEGVAA